MVESKSLIERIQEVLLSTGIPAWLFYDFRGSDPMGYRILGLDPSMHASRRWYYLVPASGTPIKLVHRIESGKLDSLPGNKKIYLTWNQLQSQLEDMVSPFSALAMQYSKNNMIPYISLVDGGTVELIRSFGTEIVSSADLVQVFEAVLSPEQQSGHRKSATALTEIVQAAFAWTGEQISRLGQSDELSVQEFIMDLFKKNQLVTDHPPIVAVNSNSGNPHYIPQKGSASQIKPGDFLLIDLWAKQANHPEAVFADITWTGFTGAEPPENIKKVFDIVTGGRDQGVSFLKERFRRGEPVYGWEVDRTVREFISARGYGDDFFCHRTGHSLGLEPHGNGVHFDDLETHDTRQVLPGVACTIEPGIYLDDFGVRSEIDILFTEAGPEITTPPQHELVII
jgi:Xaa-Pro aminopeptidase